MQLVFTLKVIDLPNTKSPAGQFLSVSDELADELVRANAGVLAALLNPAFHYPDFYATYSGSPAPKKAAKAEPKEEESKPEEKAKTRSRFAK